MFILTINGYPEICSESKDKLQNRINDEIASILNNPKLEVERHTTNTIWYFNGTSHFMKKYEIKQITVI